MMRALQLIGLACLVVACTEAAPRTDAGAQAGPAAEVIAATHLGPDSHVGIKMTPVIRACRASCWSDIPFNACAEQRDACLGTASTNADKRHCRHMSHTCRKTRRECLQGCWLGIAAHGDSPLPGATTPPAAESDEADEPAE